MKESILSPVAAPALRHEARLARMNPAARKANGVYYTPPALVDHLIAHTLVRSLREQPEGRPLTILDPACGGGVFLVAAYRTLLESRQRTDGGGLTARQRRDILSGSIFGVDADRTAVELTRHALNEVTGGGNRGLDLANTIRHGNALLAADFAGTRGPLSAPCINWETQFPSIMKAGGFSVVLGNPPWGQKDIVKDELMKQYLRRRYPSSAGIFDLFRPFVELGIHLTAPGGWFGMVLPDIVLLKNYQQTRRLLLDQLTLERIDWWGQVFPGATIDAVTIVGRKKPASAGHCVAVSSDRSIERFIPQADFRSNPRQVFNLHLTGERKKALDALARCPRLGDYFEVHEGVHSGNLRQELFVDRKLDSTCRPLLFGRDEITPYRLRWQGRYVRSGVVPARKTRQRYANLGRPEWHERTKVLVRRTGDRVLAAVDRHRRWASNNFFLIFPKQPCDLDLDGLCALLNSQFMTWYFRMIEPRQGRAFAELKIKHLTAFPLPLQIGEPVGCAQLNHLGRRRVSDESLDENINDLVREMFGVAEAN